jgi:hypothetical protein
MTHILFCIPRSGSVPMTTVARPSPISRLSSTTSTTKFAKEKRRKNDFFEFWMFCYVYWFTTQSIPTKKNDLWTNNLILSGFILKWNLLSLQCFFHISCRNENKFCQILSFKIVKGYYLKIWPVGKFRSFRIRKSSFHCQISMRE